MRKICSLQELSILDEPGPTVHHTILAPLFEVIFHLQWKMSLISVAEVSFITLITLMPTLSSSSTDKSTQSWCDNGLVGILIPLLNVSRSFDTWHCVWLYNTCATVSLTWSVLRRVLNEWMKWNSVCSANASCLQTFKFQTCMIYYVLFKSRKNIPSHFLMT